MMKQGARKFALIDRSVLDKEPARRLVNNLKEAGGNVMMDSMLAIEFRTYVFMAFSVDVPFLLLFGDAVTPNSLGELVVRDILAAGRFTFTFEASLRLQLLVVKDHGYRLIELSLVPLIGPDKPDKAHVRSMRRRRRSQKSRLED